jgi:hypothetical protein
VSSAATPGLRAPAFFTSRTHGSIARRPIMTGFVLPLAPVFGSTPSRYLSRISKTLAESQLRHSMAA